MDNDYTGAVITAIFLAPPSILGLRAIVRGPTRIGGKVVPATIDRVASAIWLAPLPLTLAIVFTRIRYFPPRTMEEANDLANVWGPMVVRVASVICLIVGLAVAWGSARPEERPATRGKSRQKRQKRRR
jgi:hypothetical protein